jgi:hypothetical protein
MPLENEELREELQAMLAANRELGPSADTVLIDGLLRRLEPAHADADRFALVRQVYDAIVPLPPSGVVALGAVHASVLVAAGLVLQHVISYYTQSVAFMGPMWGVLMFLWIAEMVVTLAVIGTVRPREVHARRSRTRLSTAKSR